MGKLNVRNLDQIRANDSQLYEALKDLSDGVDAVALQTATSPTGVQPAPNQIGRLTVTAADGIFDVAIFDNSPSRNGSVGIMYFLEYSTTPNFATATFHVVDLGAARNWRGTLGNLTLYWRAYSQFTGSAPSAPVYFGSQDAPTAVVGGGSNGPTPNPGSGSGNGPSNGSEGATGAGQLPSQQPGINKLGQL